MRVFHFQIEAVILFPTQIMFIESRYYFAQDKGESNNLEFVIRASHLGMRIPYMIYENKYIIFLVYYILSETSF